MKRIAHIFAALFLLCPSFLRAAVYSIDFNRGTLSGMSLKTGVTSTTNPELFCFSGSDYVTLHEKTSKCFYNDKGCGIRIGGDDGEGRFILTLGEEAVYVSKIVVYASKVSGNSVSQMAIRGGSVFECTIGNSELQDYSSSTPASEVYKLPEIAVDKFFVNLQLSAPKQGYVMLHRIDIYTDGDDSEDALRAPMDFIDGMGIFYNLAGQRISKPSHGLYIKGGKKYVLR